jgi:hypothetical protein
MQIYPINLTRLLGLLQSPQLKRILSSKLLNVISQNNSGYFFLKHSSISQVASWTPWCSHKILIVEILLFLNSWTLLSKISLGFSHSSNSVTTIKALRSTHAQCQDYTSSVVKHETHREYQLIHPEDPIDKLQHQPVPKSKMVL